MSVLQNQLAELHGAGEAPGTSVVHQIDPRAKLVVVLAFILAVVSYDRYQIAALLPFAAFPVVAAVLADLPLRPLLRKLAFAAPFAVMVGAFNPWLDTAPLIRLGAWELSGGWVSFASILLRFVLSVSAMLLLVATTGIAGLAVAMSALGAPRAFSAQLLFLHRYGVVLVEEARDMATAASLRSGGRPSLRLQVWVNLMGVLLLRTFERAQRIHLAMLARGYNGCLPVSERLHWRASDTRFLIASLAAIAALRCFDLPQGLGQFLLQVSA